MQKAFYYEDELNKEAKFGYLVSTPDDFDKEKESLPMIVFLHGAGERGTNLEDIKKIGLPKYFENASPVRAITLSPQCPFGNVWEYFIFAVKRLIDKIADEYNADKARISITGLSMGGFGTWSMISQFPGYFSCAAPVCGGGRTWMIPFAGKIPVWAFHGDKDETVEPIYSEIMVKKILATGGNAKLTLYPGINHDCWNKAYEEEGLFEWLISHRLDE